MLILRDFNKNLEKNLKFGLLKTHFYSPVCDDPAHKQNTDPTRSSYDTVTTPPIKFSKYSINMPML